MVRALTNKPPFNHLTEAQVREKISTATHIIGMSEGLKAALLEAEWEEGPEDRSRKDWEVDLYPPYSKEYTIRVFEFGSVTIYGSGINERFEVRKF
jgi:hypothetical protein